MAKENITKKLEIKKKIMIWYKRENGLMENFRLAGSINKLCQIIKITNFRFK